jgi:hypothetical protein
MPKKTLSLKKAERLDCITAGQLAKLEVMARNVGITDHPGILYFLKSEFGLKLRRVSDLSREEVSEVYYVLGSPKYGAMVRDYDGENINRVQTVRLFEVGSGKDQSGGESTTRDVGRSTGGRALRGKVGAGRGRWV